MSVSFNSSDAWLLQSVFHSGKENGASVSAVISTGDYINRAIFTFEEMDSGLKKLSVAGWIVKNDGLFQITAAGKEQFEKLRPKKRSLQKETLLLSQSIAQFPPVETGTTPALITKEEFGTAVANYLR